MEGAKVAFIGIVVVIILALIFLWVIPSSIEGSLLKPHYSVDATTSICGTLWGLPTGSVFFSNLKPTGYFSIVTPNNQAFCLAGVCQIQQAELRLSGPITRSVSIQGTTTIPVVNSCLTKTDNIGGLIAGNYSASLWVLEGGVWTSIATQTLVVG